MPSATEIVCALGLEDRLVAVTHECDFPPLALRKPRVTRSAIHSEHMSSREIDSAVRGSLEEQSTIYHLDRDLLEELEPDLVLTQELCDVCAVGPDEVREVIGSLTVPPAVVSLEPRTLDDVFESILLVGRLTGAETRAMDLATHLRARVEGVRRRTAHSRVVRVLSLEWLDPPFVGGHWVPEMVAAAGGRDVLGMEAEPSREVTWTAIQMANPDVVVAMPCGFDLERSRWELETTEFPLQWHDLRAVREGQVFAVDGSSYFSRPGPRLVDGVEILASILHPEVFGSAGPGDCPANRYAHQEDTCDPEIERVSPGRSTL